jgi:hypothetical protein
MRSVAGPRSIVENHRAPPATRECRLRVASRRRFMSSRPSAPNPTVETRP